MTTEDRMPLQVLLGAGTLLVVGVTFALWLGMSSTRLEHEREHRAGELD